MDIGGSTTGSVICSEKICERGQKEKMEKIKFVTTKEEKKEEYANSLLGNKMERSEVKGQQRRSKHDLKGRDYLCTKCWKSYLSYAAMYVHLKKKHNIGVEGLKMGYIKRNKVSPLELFPKLRAKSSFRTFEEKFEDCFKKVFQDVYSENINKYSEFYADKYEANYKNHPLFGQIVNIYNVFKDKDLLNRVKNKDFLKNLDSALCLFVFGYWCYNGLEENYKNVKIALLFREFLNFIGWDHLKQLAKYNIVEDFSHIKEEYSKVMLVENLPELLDDFLGIFMKEDSPGLDNSLSEIKNFITEFCNLLYNEGLINYMIEPIC